MAIQSAGEQKYYDFIEERAKSIRTGMIVWISLIGVAIIAGLGNLVIGIILGIIGIFLGIMNIKSQKELKEKLQPVTDKTDFFNQLISEDTVDIKEYRLIITREYALVYRGDIFLYVLKDMEKVEVGFQKEGPNPHKTLFLTDKKGVRHPLADCPLESDLEEPFNKAYETLMERC